MSHRVLGRRRTTKRSCVPRLSGRRGSNPRSSAWEADALPLSYDRACFHLQGFQPPSTGQRPSVAWRPVRPCKGQSLATGSQVTHRERAAGVEPAYPAWKAGARPLCHARMCLPRATLSRCHLATGWAPGHCRWLLALSRRRGSNPRPPAWQAGVLPLNYVCVAEGGGFEPPGPLGPLSFQGSRFSHSRIPPCHAFRRFGCLSVRIGSSRSAVHSAHVPPHWHDHSLSRSLCARTAAT